MIATLNDICSYRNETVDLNEATLEEYVSTESMLPNRGGIGVASSLPGTGKVKLFKAGDTLISNIRPYFKKIWRADHSGYCSNDVLVFKADGCLPDFLYWTLSSDDFFAHMTKTSKGTKMPRGDKNAIMQYEISLLNLSAQEAVCSILNPLQGKISSNSKLNDYLYEFMGALYDELFEYDEPQYGTIYDIADVVYGAAFKSSLFNEDKEGYPLIRIRDLSTYSPQFYTAEEHPKRIFIEPGFVVAGMDAEFVPTFWLGEKAVLNQRVCHFAPPENTAISESYLLFALKPLLAYIQNYASGTTVAHMGKSDLEALKVPLPKEEDLLKFAEVAEPMRKAIVSNAIESKRLAELRDALLPKLMSGEIDVSKIDLTQLNNHLAD